MENKRKHLELIQKVIDRMAGNLFFLKGWVITLITALLALFAKDVSSKKYILIAFLLIFIFWILDGYFLSQERLFRALYDDIRKRHEGNIDFSMDTRKYKTDNYNRWENAMISPTLLWFYISLILVTLLLLNI